VINNNEVALIPLLKCPDLKFQKHCRKIITLVRNQWELRGSGRIPLLKNSDYRNDDSNYSIRVAYEDYIKTVSCPDVAISLELACVLWFILKATRPAVIVDLGSGFSSYVFRLYQSCCDDNKNNCRVFSCDDNPYWLDRTSDFLTSKHLPISDLLLWEDFLRKHGNLHCDFVLYDMGHMPARLQALPRVLDLCHSNTTLIVDDIHKSAMRRATLDNVRLRKLQCYDLARFTYDRFGRYSWLIQNV
jgi:hypothetical protein